MTQHEREQHMHEAFTVHMLTDEGKQKAAQIATAFDALLGTLGGVCSPGRELSICITKLEEASFFAKKSMAKANAQG